MEFDDAASSSGAAASEAVVYNEGFFEKFITKVASTLLLECGDKRRFNQDAFERMCTGTDEGSLFHMYYEKLRSIKQSDLDKPYKQSGKLESDDVRLCSFQWQMCNALFMALHMFMRFDHAYHALHRLYKKDFEGASGSNFLGTDFPLCVLLKNIYEQQNEQGLVDKQPLQEGTVKQAAEFLFAISEEDVKNFTETAQKTFADQEREDKREQAHDAGAEFFTGNGGEAPGLHIHGDLHVHYHVYKKPNDDDAPAEEKQESSVRVEEVVDDAQEKPKDHILRLEHKTDISASVAACSLSGRGECWWKSLLSSFAYSLGSGLIGGWKVGGIRKNLIQRKFLVSK